MWFGNIRKNNMRKPRMKNEARCAIVVCTLLCLLVMGGALGYYFQNLHETSQPARTEWNVWYNFLSPIIAFGNILAFIGLTVAIYMGESQRQQQFEKTHIEGTIIAKIYQIEQALAESEKDLRTQPPTLSSVYTAYIVVYRAHYYFETLHTIETLSDLEKADAKDVLDIFQRAEEEIARSYQAHKNDHTPHTQQEGIDLAQLLNHLTGKLNMMEADMMQQMAKNIGPHASEPIQG